MGFGALFSNILTDLKFAQTANDQRANHQSGEQRGQARERSAESQVSKNPERRKVMEQLQIQQPIKQSASMGLPALVLPATTLARLPDFKSFLQFHSAR